MRACRVLFGGNRGYGMILLRVQILVLVLLLLLLRIIDDGDNNGGDDASIFVSCDDCNDDDIGRGGL